MSGVPDSRGQKLHTEAHTVHGVDVVRYLEEHAHPEDHVVVKMDIEGSEYDLLPCLLSVASLVDILFLEIHPPYALHGVTSDDLPALLDVVISLENAGVVVNTGWSLIG